MNKYVMIYTYGLEHDGDGTELGKTLYALDSDEARGIALGFAKQMNVELIDVIRKED